MEVKCRIKTGEIRTCLFSSSLIVMDGKIYILSSVEDATERKRSEHALRLANRQLNLLTGITRHDILNKISIILGFIKVAEKKSSDPAVGEYLMKIKSTTTAIRSQIEFTRFTRISAPTSRSGQDWTPSCPAPMSRQRSP